MSVEIEVSDELHAILKELGSSPDAIAQELVVFGLYRKGDVSGGRAAELLGMDRLAFQERAAELDIPYFRFTDEEWQKEMEAARELAERHSSSPTPVP